MATKTRRPKSEHAQAAAMIKRELKLRYPHTTFTARSESYSGGTSVHIDWIDGPTYTEVDQALGKYSQGTFDGCEDIYRYTPNQDELPRVKFVMPQRTQSPKTTAAIIEHLNRTKGYALALAGRWIDPATDFYTGDGWASHEIHQTFYPTSLICPVCRMPSEFPDKFCGDCGALLAVPED